MTTDEQMDRLAAEVLRTVGEFGVAIGAAWQAGLRVDVWVQEYQQLGRNYPMPQVLVDVSRKLPR